MLRAMAVLIGSLTFISSAAAEVEVGDTVLAFWEKDAVYFVGTAVEKRGADFLVVFEDGDIAVVDGAKVRKNDVKVGSKVFARWKDGSYYAGTVAKIVGRALYIHYSDGEKEWVPWSWIAIK